MKFISYALATALSISTTSPVVAGEGKTIVDTLAETSSPTDTLRNNEGEGYRRVIVTYKPTASINSDGTAAIPSGRVTAEISAAKVYNYLDPQNAIAATYLLIGQNLSTDCPYLKKIILNDVIDGFPNPLCNISA